jgi:hypothetical protein
MNGFFEAALRHGHHYGGGWSDWLAHTVASAVIHALIYSVVFRLMHRLTLGEAVALAAFVLVLLFVWSRSRGRTW